MSKQVWPTLCIVLFLLAVFLITAQPTSVTDQWFHIKSGEVIMQYGLPSHDVFSQHGAERPWHPYEWLFQIALYLFTKAGGIDSVKYFVGLFATLQVALVILIGKKLFKLHLLETLFIGALYATFASTFFTPRPQIVSFVLLLVNLYLVFIYVYKNKNLLWFTLPITYIWTWIHGALIINNILIAEYALLSLVYAKIAADKTFYKKAYVLGLFALGNTIISFLPPTGLMQYETLTLITKNKELLYLFEEWRPLYQYVPDLLSYLGAIMTIAIPVTFYAWHKRDKTFIWFIPFWSLILFGFTAVRQTHFGYLGISMLGIWFLSRISFSKLAVYKKYLLVCLGGLILLFALFIQYKRFQSPPNYTPTQEAAFIKQNHFNGNMFNNSNLGNYFIYSLYPDYKVFFDGRLDVYLCCEAPDYIALRKSASKSDNAFKANLNNILTKYDQSFALVSIYTELGANIFNVLNNDPAWVLVFWNDNTAIFVKDDGRNQPIIDKYKTTAAMPYSAQLYKEGMSDTALAEYLRMDAVTKSSHTKNTIGFMYMQKGETEKAKKYFKEAITINLKYSSAYANLAELITLRGETEEAIELYKEAIKNAPDKPAYYMRLAYLYMSQGEQERAKATLEEALDNIKYPKARKVLEANLKKLQ